MFAAIHFNLSGFPLYLIIAAVMAWIYEYTGRLSAPVAAHATLNSFVLLVGATPSVVRAATMVAALLLALWLGVGRIEPWPLLALAALVGLLWNPAWLFDLSFQLSYLAVAGMLLFGGPLLARFGGPAPRPWWHWRTLLLAAVVTSAAAQTLSLPLVAHAFGRLPLLSPCWSPVYARWASH